MLNVLVICTGNSCRSVLSEAVLNHLGADRVRAYSAGSSPIGRINEDALATLARHGLENKGYTSQSWDEFENQAIDIAITVCDNAANEICPVYINSTVRAHWGLSDPGHVKGTDQEVIDAFEATYKIVEKRVNAMLQLPLEKLNTQQLTVELNKIGLLGD